MELNNKILIRNESEALNLINDWNKSGISNFLRVTDFEKYPALICYYLDENNYSLSHSSSAYYSITYLSDFNEEEI